MPLLTARDMAALRHIFTDMAWSDPANAATVYDDDAVSNPRTTTVIIDNDTSLKSRREASQFILALFPVGSNVVASSVFQTADNRWYMVNQISNISVDVQATLTAQTLLLPYLLTRRRLVAATLDTSNIFHQAAPTEVDITTIHAGESNANDPYLTEDVGATPRGVATFYCPLGSDVRVQDYIVLPDGRPAIVQQANPLAGSGVRYGLQLLVNPSAVLSGVLGTP